MGVSCFGDGRKRIFCKGLDWVLSLDILSECERMARLMSLAIGLLVIDPEGAMGRAIWPGLGRRSLTAG